jgi:AmmeMemoRadiSam system protein B
MLSPNSNNSRVRPPAVAGLFYPGHEAELAASVQGYLAEQSTDPEVATPKALIVPHAGYVYSGSVAASAYRCLASGHQIHRVVLLGPSHRVPIRGLAVPSADFFSTPLGSVPIDVDGRHRLRELGLAGVSDAAHASEHSLEVQLPFLQSVLGEFTLLPIAVGLAPADRVSEALDAVWGGPETLIVVSSDLSHYHTANEARQLDGMTSRSILARRSDLSDQQACGARCINGLMKCARNRRLSVKLLDLRNSSETAGDGSRVVGYGSYALYDA